MRERNREPVIRNFGGGGYGSMKGNTRWNLEFRFFVTFSAILRLFCDEITGVPCENHRPTPSHWQLSDMRRRGGGGGLWQF